MGCQQSIPQDPDPRSSRPSGPMAVGRSEHLRGRAQRAKDLKKKGKHTQSIVITSATELLDQQIPPQLDANGHLMPEEVVRRTSNSITSRTIRVGRSPITLQYAHWTQRGYYPDDPHKENQDACSITHSFAGEPNDLLFAVYDGHGKHGHACARYAQTKLPQCLARQIRAARVKEYQKVLEAQGLQRQALFDPEHWPFLGPDEYKLCCQKGFLECNKALNEADKVASKMSGTTAITVSFHGDMMTVANVGDSRVVLGHKVAQDGSTHLGSESKEEETTTNGETTKRFPDKLLAIPLSRDQTPYRKDERERVKRLGASVMSIDQMEGLEEMHENWGDLVLGDDVDIHGDPPRVWVEGKDYPGTAFTRSIGDYLAEDIGVTADPEILSRELTSNDHILVLATDGIFEFLSNQEVIDMCAECDNPIVACQALVEAAYKRWLLYENRTDDITVIVCFISCDREPPTNGETGTTEDLVALASSIYGSKPIRTNPRGKNDTLSRSVEQAAPVDDAPPVDITAS